MFLFDILPFSGQNLAAAAIRLNAHKGA